MKKAIVTGAGGFVGNALVVELLSRGYEVYAVVRTGSCFSHDNVPNVHVVECNLDQYAQLPDLIKERGFAVFFHLAWEGSAGELRGQYHVQLMNVEYSVMAVNAAKALECSLFCGAGSVMEEEAKSSIAQNNSQLGAGLYYSTAKMTAHYMCKIAAANAGISFVWGMISNAYGPREVSPRFINTVIHKLIAGEEINLTWGNQWYDFVYISDMARAFCYIAERGKPFCSYFIGSGEARRLRSFVEEMHEIVNPDAIIHFGAVPFSGIELPQSVYDSSQLIQDTGYHAQVSFSQGIIRTKQWLMEREVDA